MITQKQLALKLGVSQKTVSRAINGEAGVRLEVRARILAESEASAYSPNQHARNLHSQRTQMLAVIIPSEKTFNSLYFLRTFKGITQEANLRGYTLQFINAEASLNLNADLRGVEGAILFAISVDNKRKNALLKKIKNENDIPLICIQTAQGRQTTPCISIDNFTGAHIATTHLLNLGHRNIAYVGPSTAISESKERARGYRAALKDFALSQATEYAMNTDELHNDFEKYFGTASQLKHHAAFVWSDSCARIICYQAQARHISIPDDLSLVGFDDHHAYTHMGKPYLSTVRQPLFELGQTAVNTITNHLDHDIAISSTIITPHIIQRDSCTHTQYKESSETS